MPTIINGCGTWYCGKRRIHRVKAGCGQCGGFTELESYDTTLFFVFFMIPIIPLGKKRILQSCSACQRHRVIDLKAWEAGKSEAFNKVLEELQANPDNRETIQKALALATVYQDEVLFDKLADALAGHRTEDAEIQAQLGSAYEYFSRWPDAEAAFRRAHAIAPSDDTNERLAVCLLKQYRPEEAADHVRHALESKDPEKAWLVFWLVEGFMAAGMHEEALKVMDVRDEIWPALAVGKDYQRQRRTAEKHRKTGKPIKSVYLAESKTGFREGSKLGFGWPKYVAAAIVLGLLALYFGSAIYRGQNRPVYLVNGWSKGYTVKVNGEDYQVPAGGTKKIDVPEGEVTVDWPEGGDGPQTVTIETSFWSRPFKRPVFVINPDRLAILEREETIYADPPVEPEHPAEFRAGQLLQEFKGVNHEFEPFPTEIRAKAGSRTTKTRVGLVPVTGPQDRIMKAMVAVPQDKLADYAKRLLQLDPNDTFALGFTTAMMTPADAITFLRTHLGDRPIRVEWHRMYQSLSDLADPTRDLKPEYRKLVEETKRSPDAVYLLGRLEDSPAGETMYLEAANAKPPSAHACAGLSFRYLAQGDFDKAVEWAAKGHELNRADPLYLQRYVFALLAAGKFVDLLRVTNATTPTETMVYLRERLIAHVATGEPGAADGEINRILGPRMGRPGDLSSMQARVSMDMLLAETKRDSKKYLELAARATSTDRFAENILRGNYKSAVVPEAGARPGPRQLSRDWERDATRFGILYLAGLKAKDQAFADAQWKRFTETLATGDRDARNCAAMASGAKPFDLARMKDAPLQPTLKRVVLAACARKFPTNAKELNALATKLDFERDEISLCLRYVMEP
jgi:tetratricopeptide (TPR) repeat protein